VATSKQPKKGVHDSRWERSDGPAPLSRGESQSGSAEDPGIPGVLIGNDEDFKGCEGIVEERDFEEALAGGRAQETRRPKGARAPTWTKPLGAKRGTADYLGWKPLKRR